MAKPKLGLGWDSGCGGRIGTQRAMGEEHMFYSIKGQFSGVSPVVAVMGQKDNLRVYEVPCSIMFAATLAATCYTAPQCGCRWFREVCCGSAQLHPRRCAPCLACAPSLTAPNPLNHLTHAP